MLLQDKDGRLIQQLVIGNGMVAECLVEHEDVGRMISMDFRRGWSSKVLQDVLRYANTERGHCAELGYSWVVSPTAK